MREILTRMAGSKTEFREFGKSSFAYLRKVKTDELLNQFPETEGLPVGLELWGLFDAGGMPLAVADDKNALAEDAIDRELMTVRRH